MLIAVNIIACNVGL